jgi:HNH endonuclease
MSVYVPVKLQRQIRKQFCDRCAYCQTSEALMAITFEFEHITPQSIGGLTRLENLCLACPPCNRHKSNRQSAIDAETGEQIRFFHPQLDRWTDHFQWNDNFTQIIPRTSIGKITIDILRMNRPQLVNAREMWVDVGRHPPD